MLTDLQKEEINNKLLHVFSEGVGMHIIFNKYVNKNEVIDQYSTILGKLSALVYLEDITEENIEIFRKIAKFNADETKKGMRAMLSDNGALSAIKNVTEQFNQALN